MQESFKGLLKLLGGVSQNSRGAWPKVLADELRLDHKG